MGYYAVYAKFAEGLSTSDEQADYCPSTLTSSHQSDYTSHQIDYTSLRAGYTSLHTGYTFTDFCIIPGDFLSLSRWNCLTNVF